MDPSKKMAEDREEKIMAVKNKEFNSTSTETESSSTSSSEIQENSNDQIIAPHIPVNSQNVLGYAHTLNNASSNIGSLNISKSKEIHIGNSYIYNFPTFVHSNATTRNNEKDAIIIEDKKMIKNAMQKSEAPSTKKIDSSKKRIFSSTIHIQLRPTDSQSTSEQPSRTSKKCEKTNKALESTICDQTRSENSPSICKQPSTTPKKSPQPNRVEPPSVNSRWTCVQSSTTPKKNYKSTIHIQLRPTNSQEFAMTTSPSQSHKKLNMEENSEQDNNAYTILMEMKEMMIKSNAEMMKNNAEMMKINAEQQKQMNRLEEKLNKTVEIMKEIFEVQTNTNERHVTTSKRQEIEERKRRIHELETTQSSRGASEDLLWYCNICRMKTDHKSDDCFQAGSGTSKDKN